MEADPDDLLSEQDLQGGGRRIADALDDLHDMGGLEEFSDLGDREELGLLLGDLLDEDDLDVSDVSPQLSIEDAFDKARMYRAYGADQYPQSVSIGGRFELLERLGQGSYGTVFLAQDEQLGRKVAVKVMPRGDPLVAEREGKLLAQLEHPHIVGIHDHGSQDDYRWLVLELLGGPMLKEWCAGQSAGEIVARYLEAGAGLDAAHRHGLVHRDFKPENVRLNKAGKAVVLDFGLARNLESLQGQGDSPTHVYGTFAYLAPEALQGQRAGEAGDQFAFCVSLWEALSGENPFAFEGKDMQARARAIAAEPRGGEEIPRRLRGVLRRGMAVLPGDRWPTMTRLLEALEETQRGRRWPWIVAGVAGVGLVMLVGLGVALSGEEPVERVEVADQPELNSSTSEDSILTAWKALDEGQQTKAFDALWAGYSEARQGKRVREFVDVAGAVAMELEDKKRLHDAADAWWMVRHLSLKLGDQIVAKHADVQMKKITGQLSD